MTNSPRHLVLYHANCMDGFCAAWVAHLLMGNAAEYLPVMYGQDPPDVAGRDVILLDFSYKRPVLERMLASANCVTILDHHKTAEADLTGLRANNLFVRFDMEKSGGRLAWEHFHAGAVSWASNWLVDYTEDRDLWRWKLDGSREVSAYLMSCERTFARWDRLQFDRPGTDAFEKIRAAGSAILDYQTQLVDAICANVTETTIAGRRVPVVNTPVLQSEVAGQLAEGFPFGAVWFVRADGKRQWSLRSAPDGEDVSAVARRFGGGGHRHAAGFETDFRDEYDS